MGLSFRLPCQNRRTFEGTESLVLCESGNILETVQEGDTVTVDR